MREPKKTYHIAIPGCQDFPSKTYINLCNFGATIITCLSIGKVAFKILHLIFFFLGIPLSLKFLRLYFDV